MLAGTLHFCAHGQFSHAFGCICVQKVVLASCSRAEYSCINTVLSCFCHVMLDVPLIRCPDDAQKAEALFMLRELAATFSSDSWPSTPSQLCKCYQSLAVLFAVMNKPEQVRFCQLAVLHGETIFLFPKCIRAVVLYFTS